MEFSAVVIMAIVTEAVVTYVKTWVVDKKIKWQMILAVALGVVVSLAYGLDFIALVGLKSSVPFVGNALTGILISRGSNYIYDFFKAVGFNNVAEIREVEI